MLNLSKAIYGKLSGSALAAHISARMYKGRAPKIATYPYVVFLIVTNAPEKTYIENFEDTTIQFSLFSKLTGSTEVENLYTDLKSLYDECAMTITGSTLVWMKRDNATLIVEDHTTPGGSGASTQRIWAYHVDYEIKTILD